MSRWSRFTAALPITLALTFVAAVWLAGAAWSYDEQRAFAEHLGFLLPWLLPLTIDGFAFSLAGVSYAAALDGRAAVQARLMTAVAIAASSASNACWAALRHGASPTTLDGTALAAVIVASAVPVASLISFEVLLGELRRAVWRRRGEPAPPAIPALRPVRLLLAPRVAFTEWRTEVLRRTSPVPIVIAEPEEETTEADEEQTADPGDGETKGSKPPRGRRTTRTEGAPARDRDAEALVYVRQQRAAGKARTQPGMAAHIRAAGHTIRNDERGAVLAAAEAAAGPWLEAVQ